MMFQNNSLCSRVGNFRNTHGCGRFLRERKKDIQILAVEPPSGEAVQGLRSLEDGFIPPVFENWKGLEVLMVKE